MVSEDSDQLLPGLPPVHGLGDPCDLDQTVDRQVPAAIDEAHTSRELFEVGLLRGEHRVLLEERDDHRKQIASTSHDEPVEVLPVVVPPVVHDYLSDTEELAELVETRDAFRALRHRELMRHLPAGLVARSGRAAGLADESDREASFSVYKTNSPAKPDQSFLLIFRITRHVVTTVNVRPDVTGSSAGYPGFPAYGQMHTAPLLTRGAAFYLRTVIVTAAVYRGLVSRLRPKANLST
jgi:hypothetical protein